MRGKDAGVIGVRDARVSDVPRLSEIYRRASWSNVDDRPLFGEHPEFLEWSGEPALGGRTRFAEFGGEVIGFVSTLEHDGTTEIEDLFVDPGWMRRGVATMLVDHVLRTGSEADATRVAVDANRHARLLRERGLRR